MLWEFFLHVFLVGHGRTQEHLSSLKGAVKPERHFIGTVSGAHYGCIYPQKRALAINRATYV